VLIQCDVYTKKEQEIINNSRCEAIFINGTWTHNPLIWIMKKLYLTNPVKGQRFFITREIKLAVKLR